jgi:hypothetical protein
MNENLNKVTETAMINTTARKGQHVRFTVELGRCIPPSKAMLKDFTHLDVLGKPDMDFIRSVLPTATFRPTKSGQFARLNEFDAFKAALAGKLA